MNHEFALDPGGPKRLKVSYPWNIANAEVFLDGQKILSFATKAEFQRGTSCKLPDGSILSVRFGPIAGVPFMKGVHVIRNGAPLPGSAADPVPKWAWVFIVACVLIPVITVGGAVPAGLAGAGISATLSVARLSRWSAAKRVGVCSLITLACWGSLGLLLMTLQKSALASGPQTGWKLPIMKTLFMSSSPEKLTDQIADAYSKHGYNELAITRIKNTLHENCDRLDKGQCVDYLRYALVEIQNRPVN
jgi:hypothetical protein